MAANSLLFVFRFDTKVELVATFEVGTRLINTGLAPLLMLFCGRVGFFGLLFFAICGAVLMGSVIGDNSKNVPFGNVGFVAAVVGTVEGSFLFTAKPELSLH